MRGWALTWAVLVALIGHTRVTHAEDLPTTLPAQPVPKPWEVGVSQTDRDRVNAIFAEGNSFFGQDGLVPAIEKYEEAVKIWDHPVIRMNMAVTYIRLERYIEAADSLELALRWGADPFTPEQYSMLLDYKKLVGGNVGMIEATCADGTADLLLDGKFWFKCPGAKKQRVMTGQHVVLATQRGYFESSNHVMVVPDSPSHVNIRLISIDEAFEAHRRFPRWLPGVVMGVGAGVLVGGVALWKSGSDKMQEYDQAIAANCAVNGCDLQQLDQFADLKESAIFRDKAGTAMTIVGGAAVIGGFVMLLVNRPTRRLRVDLSPSGNAGAKATLHWTF